MGYIDATQLTQLAEPMQKNAYGQYLFELLRTGGARGEGDSDRLARRAIVEPEVLGDAAGFFLETFQAERYAAAGIGGPFVQDNLSRSAKGTLRGLALPGAAPPRKAGAGAPGGSLGRRGGRAAGLASLRSLGGSGAERREPSPAVDSAGLRARLLRALRGADFFYKCTDLYALR